MKPIFTYDDFEDCAGLRDVVTVANSKIQKMIEAAPRVWSDEAKKTWWVGESPYAENIAIIFNIEELPKKECQHEPKRWIHFNSPETYEPVCYLCQKPLKATWSLRDE